LVEILAVSRFSVNRDEEDDPEDIRSPDSAGDALTPAWCLSEQQV